MHELNFDTLASSVCKKFFEIRKSKDRNVFSKSRSQAMLGVSILPTSLLSSKLESQ